MTLFSQGADLLIRQNYVDAAFFTALGREFPKRHAEIAELAAKCCVVWVPPVGPNISLPGPFFGLGFAGTLGLAAALAHRLWVSPVDAVPPAIGRIEPAPAVVPISPSPLIPAPDLSTGAEGTTGADGSSGGDVIPTIRKKQPSSKVDRPPTKLEVSEPPPTPTCALPEALRGELQALAEKVFRDPGPSKGFTVILPSGASKPNVSPRLKASETALEPLYTRLNTLDAAALGHCRDRPIDIVFSAYHTTVEFK